MSPIVAMRRSILCDPNNTFDLRGWSGTLQLVGVAQRYGRKKWELRLGYRQSTTSLRSRSPPNDRAT